MVDKNIALELYNQGYTLQKIGDRFNVSRQRIWQILKRNYALIKNHHEKKAIYNSNSRPSELYMIGKLFKLGYKVEPQPYNHPFDFLVNGKKVEMKYIKEAKKIINNYYYHFVEITSSEPIDFYIFTCGVLGKEKNYIVPFNIIKDKNTINISINPKYLPQQIFFDKYYESWELLK